MSFTNKTVLITGAAGNLGRAVAHAFAEQGARLALVERQVADLHKAFGDESAARLFVAADLLQPEQVGAAVGTIVARLGRIDVLCNLAGGFRMGPAVHATPAATWDFLFDLNARTVLHMAQAVVPHMQKRKYGKIINISSNVALTGNPNYIHYVTSKGAIIAMTRAMAREVGDWNICVNTVSPGFVVTEGRQVDPEYEKIRAQQRSLKRSQVEGDLVGTVLYLASPDSDFMTGQLLNVDGGYHFVG